MRSDSLDILAVELFGGYRRLFWLRLAKLIYLSGANREAVALIRLVRHFHLTKQRRLAKMVANRLRTRFGCYVQPDAMIGAGLVMPHPNGIVIGKGVTIGRNCTIFQQVTLGGKTDGGPEHRYPVISDNVKLFAGAKIIGGVEIGAHATVGANAVVLRSVPERHIAVGVPSVNIDQNLDKKDMRPTARNETAIECKNP